MDARIRGGGRAPLAAMAAAVLVGCGGGGGTPPGVQVPVGVRSVAASPGSDLSELNFEALGAPLVRALLSTTSDDLLDVTGRARETPSSARAPGTIALGEAGFPARLLLGSLRDAGARMGRAYAQSPQMMGPTSCTGGMGTMGMAIDDADGDDRLSAGDSMVIDLSNCVAAAGMPMTSGRMTMRLEVVELDAADMPIAVEMSAHFTGFEVAGHGSMNGELHLWSRSDATSGTERMRLRYQGMTVIESGQPLVYDFDVDGTVSATGSTFDLSGGLGMGGQVYAMVPGSRFAQFGGDPPASGWMDLRDAAGDALRLTARSNVALDLQFMHAGTVMAERLGRPWDSFRLGN